MRNFLIVVGIGAALAAGAAQAGEHRQDDARMPDACTGLPAANTADGAVTLKQARRHIAVHVAGKVVDVRADERDASLPHYHVDVRLPQGPVARLHVDARTGDITWREPPILRD